MEGRRKTRSSLIRINQKMSAIALKKKLKIRKERRKKKPHSFQIYIYRLLKALKPNHGITQKAMNVMNTFVDDMLKRIAKDAADLLIHARRKILSIADIKSAVKLNFDGELALHAINEAEKALRYLKES